MNEIQYEKFAFLSDIFYNKFFSYSVMNFFSAMPRTRVLVPDSENKVISQAMGRDNSSQLICAHKNTLTGHYKYIYSLLCTPAE